MRYEIAQRRALDDIKAAEDAYVKLARESVEKFVVTGQYASLPDDLPEEMQARAGVFVSLKKDGELRGCIGTFQPTQKDVAEEILYNAVSAALHDPRFSPLKEDELPDIVYSVDVLTEPELIHDAAKDLDPKRYGVIVEARGRKGLLLPDLEGVDTVEDQIKIARKKGGIALDDDVRIWRFEVERHH